MLSYLVPEHYMSHGSNNIGQIDQQQETTVKI